MLSADEFNGPIPTLGTPEAAGVHKHTHVGMPLAARPCAGLCYPAGQLSAQAAQLRCLPRSTRRAPCAPACQRRPGAVWGLENCTSQRLVWQQQPTHTTQHSEPAACRQQTTPCGLPSTCMRRDRCYTYRATARACARWGIACTGCASTLHTCMAELHRCCAGITCWNLQWQSSDAANPQATAVHTPRGKSRKEANPGCPAAWTPFTGAARATAWTVDVRRSRITRVQKPMQPHVRTTHSTAEHTAHEDSSQGTAGGAGGFQVA
jgi:hypothetical protein